MAQTREQVIAKMKAIESRVVHYRNTPEALSLLRNSCFERVWTIFSSGVIKPEAASFVVGRIFEALAPWREAQTILLEYEGYEAKLKELAAAENSRA